MRESFWNIGDVRTLVHLLMIIPFSVFLYGLFRHFRLWSLGQRRENISHISERLQSLFSNVFTHRRILKDRYAGWMHIFIFGGFLLLFLGTLVIFVEDTFGTKLLQGRFYEYYELVLDLAGLFVCAGVFMVIYRRYFLKPSKLETKREDGFVFLLLFLIILSGFMIEGLRLSLSNPQASLWSPVGYIFGSLFQFALLENSRLVLHRFLWWFHLGLSFFFIGFIPFSKLFHMFAAPLHIFVNSVDTTGKMTAIDLHSEKYGVNQVQDFTWDTLLALDACTECGRCRSVCPSYLSGGPLDPRKIILALQKRMRQEKKGHAYRNSSDGLVGNCVTQDEIWACNTCLACVKECPIFIDPMHRLLDFRHHLVLADSKIPPEIERVYRNLEWIGDPFGMGKLGKDELSKSSIIKKNNNYDLNPFLFWVGCQGYFNERNRRTVEAIFRLLGRFNIRFMILGRQEPCCGDIARRTGNEYLFRKMAEENIQLLKKKEITKIVTGCPHCFNVLKHEYPELGGRFQVIHYVELLENIFPKNSPMFAGDPFGKVTFQDPCYLSRYNELVSEPRSLLQSIPGVLIKEMDRSKANSFCCGGGGGGVLLGGQTRKRVNEVRIQEALATNADYLVTACPYCFIMLEDGAKNLSAGESSLKVVDIAEVLDRALAC